MAAAATLYRYAPALVAIPLAGRAHEGYGRSGMSVTVCRVVIRGRVQGVGYRAWTEYTALDLGLAGWVRNRRDGSVEAVFAGPAEAVVDMIEACRRGPPGARVNGIDQRDGTAGELAMRGREQFAVLHTV